MNISVRKFGDTRFDGLGVYVGRSQHAASKFSRSETVLGNPYRLQGRSEEARAEAVGKYRDWLWKKITECNVPVLAALNRLLEIHEKYGRLILVCHCVNTDNMSGNTCHAQVLAKALVWWKGEKAK